MCHPGGILVIIKLLVTGISVVWWSPPSAPPLGKLLGDVRIERQHFRFDFPVTSCMLLRQLVTAIVWLVRHFSEQQG